VFNQFLELLSLCHYY